MPLIEAAGLSHELDVSVRNIRSGLERLESDGILRNAQVQKNRRAWRAGGAGTAG